MNLNEYRPVNFMAKNWEYDKKLIDELDKTENEVGYMLKTGKLSNELLRYLDVWKIISVFSVILLLYCENESFKSVKRSES